MRFTKPTAFRYVSLVTLILLVAQLALPALASAPREQADAGFADALWIARGSDVLKLDRNGATRLEALHGTLKSSVSPVRAVAVDQLRAEVWLFDGALLHAFDQDGRIRVTAPFDPAGSTGTPRLAAHDGNVWLGLGEVLYRFDDQGRLASTLPLTAPLTDLALDARGDRVWLATGGGVFTADTSGALDDALPLDGVRALAVGPAQGELWVARGDVLERYGVRGERQLDVFAAAAHRLAADGRGGVWALTRDGLMHFAEDGLLLHALEQVGPGTTVALAAHPRARLAWVATTEGLYQVNAAGRVRRLFDLEAAPLADLALFVPAERPEVQGPPLAPARPVSTAGPKAGTATCTLTPAPTHDAYTRSGTFAGTNFGSDTVLEIKDGGSNYDRRAYITFDLSGYDFSTTGSAVLNLYVDHIEQDDVAITPTIEVYTVPDETWTEGTITWDTMPALGSVVHTWFVDDVQKNTWVEFDLTSLVNSELAGDKVFSLGFWDVNAANEIVEFASKEDANRPFLEITATSALCGELPTGVNSFETRVSASDDDAEQDVFDGSMMRSDVDLNLTEAWGETNFDVGLRFQDVTIPRGALIKSAYLELEAVETDSKATSLVIHGEAANNALPFEYHDYNVSNRPSTTTTVSWADVPAWKAENVYRTPDLAAVVQEIVDRDAWRPGNAMVFVVSGTGERLATSYDGNPQSAPLLHVEYGIVADFSTSVTNGPAPLTVQFTDQSIPGTTTLTSWQWDFDDDGIIDSTAQNPSHTYANPGTYSVSLTVSDGTSADTETKQNHVTAWDEGLIVCTFNDAGSDDAYTRSGAYATTNFGSDINLEVKDGGSDFDRRSYLKFDLNEYDFSTTTSALLKVFVASIEDVDPALTPTLNVYAVKGDSWSESTLTWDTMPPFDEVVQTWMVDDAQAGTVVAIDITPWVNAELTGDKVVSVGLWDVNEANERVRMRSKEGSNPPVLELTAPSAACPDDVAPTISFVTPADGETVSGPRPQLVFAIDDLGGGADTASLAVTSAGVGLPVSCQETAQGALCQPLADLPDGPNTLTATIADFAGNVSAPATVTFTLNRPPVLSPVGDQTVALGGSLALQLVANDPDGDTLSYMAAPLPLPGSSRLDGTTGLYSFTPKEGDVGTHNVTFSVSDGVDTASETVTITVSGPVPGTPTAITGRLLDTNDYVLGVETPIVGATITLGVSSGTSGADGSFLISGIVSGDQVLYIDSSTANLAPDGSPYASFAEALVLIEGVTNVFDRPFFLPRVDPASLTTVDPMTTTTVNNPNLGVTVTIPPATAKLPNGSDFTGQLSVSEVPLSLAPVSLPEELSPAMLLTIQPVGVSFTNPVPVSMPNMDGMPPGSELDLWSVNPDTGVFEIVGVGRVTADGSMIETISGGIRTASWHSFLGPLLDFFGGGNNGDNRDPDRCDDCASGSQTALSSGNLSITHDLPAYFSLDRARSLRLVYNSEHADPRPTVSSQTTISRRAAVPPTVSAAIEVGGVRIGDEVFTNTSGLSENVDETLLQVLQVDATDFATGSYGYRMRLTSNYASSAVSSFQTGQILVHNMKDSPVGAGWSLDRLQRLHVQADRSVVLTDGNGGIMRFDPAPTAGNGLMGRFYNTGDPVGAVSNDFAGLTPGIFQVTTASTSLSTDSYTFPVVHFPDNSFDGAAFYNVGPNGFVDPGSGAGTPQGDDISIQPPGGNDTFGAQFSGYLFLPTGGDVTFSVGVDDAFKLVVNGSTVSSFLGTTNYRTVTATATGLPSGFVPITLNYGESGGEANVVLQASGGGLPGGVIPPTSLFLAPAGGGLPDAFLSPTGDFSVLHHNGDGTFTRTFKDGTAHHFDADGLQTAAVDASGNTTTYGYDATGRLLSVTDPVGLVTALSYVGGHLSSITDPVGRVTNFDHDAAGNLIRITDADGAARDFTYDASHRLVSQLSKRGFTVSYGYDFAGHHTSVVRADGALRSISPKDTVGLADPVLGLGKTKTKALAVVRPADAVARYVDGNGNVTTFDTDRFGASVRSVSASGRVTTATRDQNGNPTRITNSNGSTQDFTYDSNGNLTSFRQTAAGGAVSQEIQIAYDPDSNEVTGVTDPMGNSLTIGYDAAGNPDTIVDPLGATNTATYNSRGQTLTATDPNNHTTSFTYDAFGNTETVTDPRGTVTRFTRDAAGRVTAVTEAVGLPEERTSSITYDVLNRALTTTDAEGNVTRSTYDASGNPVRTILPTGEETLRTFDEMGRLVRLEDPASGIQQFLYDANGNVVAAIDAKGFQTTFEYDSSNRLVRTVDALGGVQSFTYDPRGNLVAFQNAKGQTWTIAYDELDRQVQRTDPLGNSASFTYDARSYLASATTTRGDVFTYTYDELGRLIGTVGPDNTLSQTFDSVGNLMSIAENDSRLDFTYDELGRPLTVQVVDVGVQPAVTLTATYDALGNRIALGDSAGGVTSYAYDKNGRMSAVTPPSGGPISLAYDPAGRLDAVAYPSALSLDYDYDTSGRLSGLHHRDGSGGALSSFSYLYDAVGNLLQVAEGAKVRQYSYDALERLRSGGTAGLPETYDYDAVGNRVSSFLSATGSFDQANRLLEDDHFVYSYDAAGNLTSKSEKATGATTSYQYDAQGQLIRVDAPDGSVSTYRYDALTRRIEKNVDGVVTRYVYDGTNILLEYDGSNSLTARYTHGPGVDQVLSMERGGQRYYYLTDHQGSVRSLVDSAGTEVNSYDYDSFGRLLVIQETVANPFTYTGRELDAESGLYFYRARYYDPEVGRFLSQDPMGLAGGNVNFYAYVGNNPANVTDPSGLFTPWDVLDVISFGMSLADFIECPTLANGLWLALDTISLLPIIPSLGIVKRGADMLDLASDAGRLLSRTDDVVDGLRAVDGASDLLTGLNRASDIASSVPEGKRLIIIGENMERVRDFANRIEGATTYRPWANDPFNFDLAMRRNQRWIQDMIREGNVIIDIGPDFSRRWSRVLDNADEIASPFYELERTQLRLRDYDNYFGVFDRFGKFSGGVPGFDFP